MTARPGWRQHAGGERAAWRLAPGGVVAALVAALAIPSLAAAGGAAAATTAAGIPAAAITVPALRAWGDNSSGQFGNGTTTDSATPVSVTFPFGTKVTAVSGGCRFALALTSTGRVLAWGFNAAGELGDGTTTDRATPVSVHLPQGTTVTAISAGCGHSLALTSTGQVLAWGQGSDGQLGDGTTSDSDVPVSVSLPQGTTVTAIGGGDFFSLARTSDGQVLAWGNNAFGQLGDGTTTSSDTPVPVSLPQGVTVTAVSADEMRSLALTSTGQVLAWGFNSHGQLGDGTTTDSHVPVSVALPAGTTATAIAAGAFHSLALTSTGQVLSWGSNHDGELGDGTPGGNSDLPVSVALPAGAAVTAIAAGAFHSVALTSTGQVLTWGFNGAGQLGDGTTTSSDVPVQVTIQGNLKATAVGAGRDSAAFSLAIVNQPVVLHTL